MFGDTKNRSLPPTGGGPPVVELVRDVCLRTNLDEVATVTERVQEFYAFMDELVSASVERTIRDPGSPGRPRGRLVHVALIEQVMVERSEWRCSRASPSRPSRPG